jgi:regulator of cell morphogenesis and NO signaling
MLLKRPKSIKVKVETPVCFANNKKNATPPDEFFFTKEDSSWERTLDFDIFTLVINTVHALANTRLEDLVIENRIRAKVLFYFGIKFYEHSEQTLAQVCAQKGLSVQQVVREFEQADADAAYSSLPLVNYPIELIIEYLKHAHFVFVKRTLPYLGRLIDSFHPAPGPYLAIGKDLQLLYPLLLEDFIHHIYEEEDTLFTYILQLDRAQQGVFHPARLFYTMEKNSIHRFAVDHEAHEDEMAGIRSITHNYQLEATAPLHLKIIYAEMQAFEESLMRHASIENNILFPKAMALENTVRQAMKEKISLN